MTRFVLAFLLLLGGVALPGYGQESRNYDLVIYGGTSGGIAAAIQARRMGLKEVVLIEPTQHLGGLTTGGLGATDIGNKAAIGGVSREFYQRIGAHYADEKNWKYQTSSSYGNKRQGDREAEMWTFEPHVAEAVYENWLQEVNVPVVRGERLDLAKGVKKDGTRIVSITMESGRQFAGKMFIDATYEGDLMAKAGVKYHVGRESNATYGETLNGIQVARATHHQFIKDVDPYVKKGDPSSGLLPLVQKEPPGNDGDGDHRVQAYNFRMCTTDVPENRKPWTKPAGYKEETYELLLRNCEAGDPRNPWNPVMMPNRKTDTNNNFAISTDYIGANYQYPDGDYKLRQAIYDDHRNYQLGLMYTLANHPRVPEKIRQHFQNWGLAKDEFLDTDNWPRQLYVREARRMISEYVMSQNNCQGKMVAEDSVGMGAYNMDSHNCQRYVTKEGFARNEGDIQVGVSPYPISYKSIRPREEECSNLLVPVCLSASHIAYGSIRMEPVFMVLGQSSATAAAMAIEKNTSVQDVDYAALRTRLLADKQVLEWTGPKRASREAINAKDLPGVVVDNPAAKLDGEWSRSSSIGGYIGEDYLTDGNEEKGNRRAVFQLKAPQAGEYEVRLAYTANENRASNVAVRVKGGGDDKSVTVNQRKAPADKGFEPLLKLTLTADDAVTVTVTNEGSNGYVIVDAVQLLPLKK